MIARTDDLPRYLGGSCSRPRGGPDAPASIWQEPSVSSRLIEYEILTRIHARRLGQSRGDEVRALLARVSLIEMAPPVLARALEPFPRALRTLDALPPRLHGVPAD